MQIFVGIVETLAMIISMCNFIHKRMGESRMQEVVLKKLRGCQFRMCETYGVVA